MTRLCVVVETGRDVTVGNLSAVKKFVAKDVTGADYTGF